VAVVVVTADPGRQRRLEDCLKHVTFPLAVVAMPELTDLL
jgi:hypothetical protein